MMNDDSQIFMTFLPNEAATTTFAAACAKVVTPGCVLYLQGQLGAGKTTFVRGFLQALGYEGKVKSPSYSLLESYEIHGKKIHHFDFYRLGKPEEAQQLGLADYFTDDAICLIEWPTHAGNFLPPADVDCLLAWEPSGRKITLFAHSARGAMMLNKL